MKQKLAFVTGNKYKFEVVRKVLAEQGVTLVQQNLDTPEIQSANVEEVASYSATWASDRLQKPVIITDAGYYIKALNGFPGPYGPPLPDGF